MGMIRQYLLSVVAAALICSIIKTFICGKGILSTTVKMICGLFLALVVFSPIITVDLSSSSWESSVFIQDAEEAVAKGTSAAEFELQKIIKEKTETYIHDKASSLHLNITADVTINKSAPFIPCSVLIRGAASPYAKETLQSYIVQELGIPKEAQRWI